jgi:hypothetical protein
MRFGIGPIFLSLSLLGLSACAEYQDTAAKSVKDQPLVASASTDSKQRMLGHKRPRPDELQFVKGWNNYTINSQTWGQIWFRNVDQKTYIEYKPFVREYVTETQIVVQCIENRMTISFPINGDYYGPAPACPKDTDLVLAAR